MCFPHNSVSLKGHGPASALFLERDHYNSDRTHFMYINMKTKSISAEPADPWHMSCLALTGIYPAVFSIHQAFFVLRYSPCTASCC